MENSSPCYSWIPDSESDNTNSTEDDSEDDSEDNGDGKKTEDIRLTSVISFLF